VKEPGRQRASAIGVLHQTAPGLAQNQGALLGLREFLKTMYARPKAPLTIAEGFAAIRR
jgi:hypothetical protein